MDNKKQKVYLELTKSFFNSSEKYKEENFEKEKVYLNTDENKELSIIYQTIYSKGLDAENYSLSSVLIDNDYSGSNFKFIEELPKSNCLLEVNKKLKDNLKIEQDLTLHLQNELEQALNEIEMLTARIVKLKNDSENSINVSHVERILAAINTSKPF